MLLQVVLVIVAPFGITRIASAVANCSDDPWAVARLPPARAMDPKRRLAINSAAFRIVRAGRGGLLLSVYTERFQVTAVLCSTAAALSSHLVQQPPRHQRWRCGLGSALASLAGLGAGIGGGGSNPAG